MKALFKDFFRGMLKNKGKFISVFFIILLGAAFFSGLRASKTDMLLSAEQYYDSQSLADITVVSTAGLTEDDVSSLSSLNCVEAAEGIYTLDVISENADRCAIKLISLSSQINVPSDLEGKLPENANEVVLDKLLLEIGNFSIGDSITFSAQSGLKEDSFVICGFACSAWSDNDSNFAALDMKIDIGKRGESDFARLIYLCYIVKFDKVLHNFSLLDYTIKNAYCQR